MSYTWVMKYLPHKFKDSVQSERRAGSVTRCVTRILDELLRPPKVEGTLKIINYASTGFVLLMHACIESEASGVRQVQSRSL